MAVIKNGVLTNTPEDDKIVNALIASLPIKTIIIDGEAAEMQMLRLSDDHDYKWWCSCLKSRLEHPEYYKSEDVPKTIEKLKRQIKDYELRKARAL